jgi:glycosyltransferase involved in cell wall biosynthesis
MTGISIITSIYNDDYLITDFIDVFNKKMAEISELNYEFVFIDDGSNEKSVMNSKSIVSKHKNAKLIELSRNFGQHAALGAALDFTSFNTVVRCNLDLQDSLDELSSMYKIILSGRNLVIGRYYDRKDKLFKRLTANVFYKVLYLFSGHKQENNTASLRMYSEKYITALKESKSLNLLPQGLDAWLGFKPFYVNINHNPREKGNSSYNFKNKFNLATDSVIYFSSKPLKIIFIIGVIMSFLSLLIFIFLQVLKFTTDLIPGYYTIVSLITLGYSIIILMIGVISLYISNIFDAVRERPSYILKINDEEQ